MKIYHSFWEKGWNKLHDSVYNMHKLSALTALKNYGNIHLITTEEGKKLLGDIPYTSIELYEEPLPNHLSKVWSLSKIYAYKQICKKNEPFFHIDYDVFLFKRLPEWFENCEIGIQHMEVGKQILDYYYLDVFFNNCPNKYLSNEKNIVAYNMGIFGGNNVDAIKFYADESLKLLHDEENQKSFWLKNGLPIVGCTKSVVLEQWYLPCCLNNINVRSTALLNEYEDLDKQSIELGYCHVWGSKWDPIINQKIKNRIQQFETVND